MPYFLLQLRLPAILNRFNIFCCFLTVSNFCLHAQPVPHPEFEGRLIDVRNGVRYEYSPDLEGYVEQAERIVSTWPRQIAELQAELAKEPVKPLSAKDLSQRQDEYLKAIAEEIGLQKPTDLQRHIYELFTLRYASTSLTQETFAHEWLLAAERAHITFWHKSDIVAALNSGKTIPNFSLDPESDTVHIETNFLIAPNRDRFSELLASHPLKHHFNYSTKFSTSARRISISAGFTIPAELYPELIEFDLSKAREALIQSEAEPLTPPQLLFPWMFKEGADHFFGDEFMQAILQFARNNANYVNTTLASTVFHETAEAGIIENYIVSKDRRWLCDGTADYVAWKVTERLNDAATAQLAYDIEKQLRTSSKLQKNIDLLNWSAAESQSHDFNGALKQAHYVFAAQAVFLMAELHGDDFIPKFWREIGKTPRGKTNFKTAQKAYRTLTGKGLKRLVKRVEATSLPATEYE